MDSNGPLYHTFARDYSSQLTRFISEDPLGFDGGSANLFTYGSNNPVSNTDPLGECDIAGCGDFAGEQGSTVARSGEGGSPFSLGDWINSIISFFSDLFGGGGSQPVVIPRKRRHRAHIIQIQYWGGSADEIMDQQQTAPGIPAGSGPMPFQPPQPAPMTSQRANPCRQKAEGYLKQCYVATNIPGDMPDAFALAACAKLGPFSEGGTCLPLVLLEGIEGATTTYCTYEYFQMLKACSGR